MVATLIQPIEKIELLDGSILEINPQNKWLENPQIRKAFREIIAASRVDKTSPVLRFFFVHKSYFQAFEELGLPLLFMPIVSNFRYYHNGVADAIKLSKEKAKEEFSEFVGGILPSIVSEYFAPFVQSFMETFNQSQGLSEEEVEKKVLFKAIEKMKGLPTEGEVKKFVKKHISPEIFSHALSLGKIGFRFVSNSLVEKGIEQYERLVREISDNNSKLLEETTNALIECKVVTPIGTIAICVNPHCGHLEARVSEIIPKARCVKCNSDALLVTSSFINEPYLQIKDQMYDLHTILYSYIKSKGSQEYIDNELVPSIRCFLTSYVRKATKKEDREVDALIYSLVTKRAIPIEIKMHQVRGQLPKNRLQNILKKDLKQLAETMKQTGLGRGYYVTNLIINDEDIQDVKEKMVPKMLEEGEIEIISATDEKRFLKKIDELIKDVQKEI